MFTSNHGVVAGSMVLGILALNGCLFSPTPYGSGQEPDDGVGGIMGGASSATSAESGGTKSSGSSNASSSSGSENTGAGGDVSTSSGNSNSNCNEKFPTFKSFASGANCYALSQEFNRWDEAKQYCADHGANLATISDDDDWFDIIGNTLGAEFWIGGRRDPNIPITLTPKANNAFIWVAEPKEKWTLSNNCNGMDPGCEWAVWNGMAQQPDGSGECVCYYPKGDDWSVDGLDDENCSKAKRYLCEWAVNGK